MNLVSGRRTLFRQKIRTAGGWSLLALLGLIGAGCGRTGSTAPAQNAPDLGPDAFQAAQRLVALSLRPSAATTITFGQPGRDSDTGFERQKDGSWKTWGWVDLPDATGRTERVSWRSVMHYLGEGRKWRSSWMRIDNQESGEPSTWIGGLPPAQAP